MLRGFVKLKKIQKSEKTRIGQTTPTHPYIQSNFFLETCTKTKNYTKTQHFQKKPKSELGLYPPTHFRVFLGFF